VSSNKRQRDSQVQVDYLRGTIEVGTGLSVTRRDKAKNNNNHPVHMLTCALDDHL
jgi:hypothetical protein